MHKNNERTYILLLQITASFAVLGIAILIFTRWQNGPSAIFDLMAYVVSIAALALTTIQSLTMARQIRIAQDSAQIIDNAAQQLKALAKHDQVMTTELKKDIALDQKNERLVRSLYKEENTIEQKIEELIAELKKSR